MQQLETTSTMVADAVVDKVHQKIFEKITSRKDIPEEYGTREEMMYTSTKFQVALKEQMKISRLVKSIIIRKFLHLTSIYFYGLFFNNDFIDFIIIYKQLFINF